MESVRALRLPLLFSLMATLVLAACEDPSNVGLGLVDEQGGTPLVRTVAPTETAASELGDLTGNAEQVLVGTVEDPVTGTVTTEAYIDFVAPGGLDIEFRESPIQDVSLILTRSYVYGDTTAQLNLAVYDLLESWSGLNAPADTTIDSAETPIVEAPFSASDSTVTVTMPADWIAANADTLRSETFASGFLGLRLTATGGNAVVGFADGTNSRSVLRIATQSDTLDYALSQNITRVERLADPQPPPGYLLLQDGAGPGVRLNFDFVGSITPNDVLNRGVIRIKADTLAFPAPPTPTYVRPPLRSLELLVVDTLGIRVPLAAATLNTEGFFQFDTIQLRTILTEILDGERTNIDHFRVVPTIRPGENAPLTNTVSALLFFDGTDLDGPEAILTVTPLDD
ncbi:MAG: hypothetical protein AAGI71_03215 [Bacteroidota bacterium]